MASGVRWRGNPIPERRSSVNGRQVACFLDFHRGYRSAFLPTTPIRVGAERVGDVKNISKTLSGGSERDVVTRTRVRLLGLSRVRLLRVTLAAAEFAVNPVEGLPADLAHNQEVVPAEA